MASSPSWDLSTIMKLSYHDDYVNAVQRVGPRPAEATNPRAPAGGGPPSDRRRRHAPRRRGGRGGRDLADDRLSVLRVADAAVGRGLSGDGGRVDASGARP